MAADHVTVGEAAPSEAPGLLIEMSDVSITLLGGLVGDPTPHSTCRMRSWTRGVGHLAKIAAGFGISESTAHAYATAVIGPLAERSRAR